MNHVLLCAEDSEAEFRSEFCHAFAGAALSPIKPLLFTAEFDMPQGQFMPRIAHLRQWLPDAIRVQAESIRAWVEATSRVLTERVPENQPWALHLLPHYGAQQTRRMGARAWHTLSRIRQGRTGFQTDVRALGREAGRNRCVLIRQQLLEHLRSKRRHLLKTLLASPEPFTPETTLVQVCLTTPDNGFLSVLRAPGPFTHRHLISHFPLGQVEVPGNKAAPSRAFAKLVEAELRLGRGIQRGELCVDLGAAPGSWTYVAASRGAQVLAIDRTPLREDLMHHPGVRFMAEDAFRFIPQEPVVWLLCDVITEPARTAELLLRWLRADWCKAFVVTLKLKDSPESLKTLATLVRAAEEIVDDLRVNRLCANKKEVCVFGTLERRS